MTDRVKFLDLAAAHAEIAAELRDAYERVVRRSSFVLGEEVAAFEKEFAAYCGVQECVSVGNGMDALELLLRAYGIGPGDEVLVPAFTFVATWFCVSRVGATPVPIDVTPDTFTLDPDRLAASLSSKTRAIIPVHLYGHPADMEPIRDFARKNGVIVIEDAAQAHGARYRGQSAGSLGDSAAFSFYPAKNLGALGDGGAIVTSDASIARRVRRLRNYGSESKYVHDEIGGNSRLDELQAAFLRVKLARLDDWNAARRNVAARYRERLAHLGNLVELPLEKNEARHAWHLFVICVNDRDRAAQTLQETGIETLVHYPKPVYRQPAYTDAPLLTQFPVSDRLAKTVLSLPMGPHIQERQVDAVCNALVSSLHSRA